jgi:hypothetical protein
MLVRCFSIGGAHSTEGRANWMNVVCGLEYKFNLVIYIHLYQQIPA